MNPVFIFQAFATSQEAYVTMNGIHDMGGMHGFGVVPIEDKEPVFHEPWEGRVFGLAFAVNRQGLLNPEGMRLFLESLEPSFYIGATYYEKWLAALQAGLVFKEIITKNEFVNRLESVISDPNMSLDRSDVGEITQKISDAINTHISPMRDVAVEPNFSPGDMVKVKNINPEGHTRLPRYVRGKKGVIYRYYGVHDFDDSRSQGLGDCPQPLYNVMFSANELWGSNASTRDALHIDMWESYLEREQK
tara:strand:- start:14 stop:754 length:741 start_codon:yes stop_codon:yes gene_type:complete